MEVTTDPAHRHGGPDAGWYRPTTQGWQRITDTEARLTGALRTMSDPA